MIRIFCIVVLSASVFIAGCGNQGNTSSGGGTGAMLSSAENSLATGTGGVIHVTYDDKGTVGEAISIRVKFREQGIAPGASTGTLHWGDITDDRVRDGMTVQHIYSTAGTYKIALHSDGGEKVVVATMVIEEAIASRQQPTSCTTSFSLEPPPTVSCSDPNFRIERRSFIDDTSGRCPVMQTGGAIGAADTIVIRSEQLGIVSPSHIAIANGVLFYYAVSGRGALVGETCFGFSSTRTSTYSATIAATSGALWDIEFSITRDAGDRSLTTNFITLTKQ